MNAKVVRLKASLTALGPDNVEERRVLEEFRVATVAPVGQRLDDCEKFCERVAKRFEKAQEAVSETLKAQSLREEELADGKRRLSEFRAEAAAQPLPERPTFPGTDELGHLRRQVAQMKSELRHSHWAVSGDSEELRELRRGVEEFRRFLDEYLSSAMKSSCLMSEVDGKRSQGVNTGPVAFSVGGCEGTKRFERSQVGPSHPAPPPSPLPPSWC